MLKIESDNFGQIMSSMSPVELVLRIYRKISAKFQSSTDTTLEVVQKTVDPWVNGQAATTLSTMG